MKLVKNVEHTKSAHQAYNLEGGSPNIYFPRSLFAGEPPDSIEADAAFVVGVAKRPTRAKMTPEERKAANVASAAARKAETPAQKADRAKKAADKANARAAKLEAAAAVSV